ncbi:MAG: SMP-30/gluconolactonase/LRE family protein [Halieaceae bacterium]|nr:SMP-30/gluconolactonase/LRE family protein [Halieaceae bacterium]
MMYQLKTLTSDPDFGEGPRWRNDKLWFSDVKAEKVKTVDIDGNVEVVLNHVEGRPSGLGWLPDDSMVVVSMDKHQVMKVDNDELTMLADTSHISRYILNDMVVDQSGNIFLSNVGFNYEAGEEVVPTAIIRVTPDGTVYNAAGDVWAPNGMAITADGKTLVVGQSSSPELLGFDLASDGELSGRHVYALLPEGAIADGICVDLEGALWVASPLTREFIRVRRGGEVTHRISTGERYAIACMLGGEHRKTLFCMTCAGISLSASAEELGGRIETMTVEVPGAGWP